MYHIYHTPAIVLGSLPRSEADRVVFLFTRELGLIAASARSLRREPSKLRYILQTSSAIEADLVRGKGGWRLTSARGRGVLMNDAARRTIFFSFSRLLVRLCADEEGNTALFDDVHNGLVFMARLAPKRGALRDAEMLLVLRTLDALGYWGDRALDEEFLFPLPWTEKLLESISSARSRLLPRINSALKETQL